MKRLRAQRRIDYKEYSTSGTKEYRKRRPSSIRNLIQRVGGELIAEELQQAVHCGQQSKHTDGAVNLTNESADLTDAVFDLTDGAIDFTDIAAALADVALTLNDEAPTPNVLVSNTEPVALHDHNCDSY